MIVSDLQTNSQLFSQGLIGLKIRLYSTPSPTTNDCDSYFIVWFLSIVILPYTNKPVQIKFSDLVFRRT